MHTLFPLILASPPIAARLAYRFTFFVSLTLVLAVPGPVVAQVSPRGAPRSITVGVVQDGASPGDTLLSLVEREVQLLAAASGRAITFKSVPAFSADWRADRMRPALQAALDDPEVDAILTTGLLITQAATRMQLNKPVISAFVQRTDLFRSADLEGNRSVVPNLNFLLMAGSIVGDIGALGELGLTGPVYVAMGREYAEQFERLDAEAAALSATTGIEVLPYAISTDIDASVGSLPDDALIVLLATTPRLGVGERAALIDGLTARGVTTFSLAGHDEVELGALAARTPDVSTLVSRRAALNLAELARGTPVGELPILVSADPRLLINGRTALALGFRPSMRTLGYATFLHAESLDLQREPLTFAQTLQLAERSNLALAIADRDVEISLRQKDLARSPLLPQILAVSDLTGLNAGGLEGIIPDRIWSAGFRASQMIYDDRRISDFRSSSRLYESSRFRYQADRLDLFRDAGSAYLQMALAEVLYRIQLSFLRLTEENLELAKFREEVGYSGRDEVYRWESEAAQQRSDVFDRLAVFQARRIALNQILAVDQGTRWEIVGAEIDPDVFPFLEGQFPRILDNKQELERFRLFSIDFAILNAPELASVGKDTEAQQIQLGQRKRRWFLPVFFLEASYDYQIERDPQLSGVDRSFPRFAVGAQYPIFVGASRSYEVSQNRAALERLETEYRLTHDLIERQTRTALRRMESSFPSIRFERLAADAARRNFDLVQDKYGQGIVNVTDLIQAQTQAFVAEQGAAAAEFRFQLDLVDFQRALSWFQDDKTVQQVQDLARSIQQATDQ